MYPSRKSTRLLYLLAKGGEPIRKQKLSHATSRWTATDRDQQLAYVQRLGWVESQSTPAEQGKREGRYYWLTEDGLAQVDALVKGEIIKLPEGWRQRYGSGIRNLQTDSGVNAGTAGAASTPGNQAV